MDKLKESRRAFFAKGFGLAGAGFFSTFGQGLEAAVERTPSASTPSDLKITDVKCGYVRGAVYVKPGCVGLWRSRRCDSGHLPPR
jgi:galactonate dehydratase